MKFSILVLTIIIFAMASMAFCQDENRSKDAYRILYIFPHPDDESYGPAAGIDKDIKAGHEVHLLTLTKGGATKQRFRLNLTIEQMGEVRYKEMLDVEKTLNLTSMTVLDMVDGGLKEYDPREIEKVVHEHIVKIDPDVIVTYPVHGISGYIDHLVIHAVAKRVFMELKDADNRLKRLVFTGLTEEDNKKNDKFKLHTIIPEETDCIVKLSRENVEVAHKALDCYVTYKPAVEGSKIKEMVQDALHYEFFMESFDQPVGSLTEKLPVK